jgi:hypothetical protein
MELGKPPADKRDSWIEKFITAVSRAISPKLPGTPPEI